MFLVAAEDMLPDRFCFTISNMSTEKSEESEAKGAYSECVKDFQKRHA